MQPKPRKDESLSEDTSRIYFQCIFSVKCRTVCGTINVNVALIFALRFRVFERIKEKDGTATLHKSMTIIISNALSMRSFL